MSTQIYYTIGLGLKDLTSDITFISLGITIKKISLKNWKLDQILVFIFYLENYQILSTPIFYTISLGLKDLTSNITFISLGISIKKISLKNWNLGQNLVLFFISQTIKDWVHQYTTL